MSTEPNDAASGGVPSAHVGDETGGQHCCPPCAIHTPGEDARSLAALSEWIDDAPANAARDREAATWGRLAKIPEEAGEVIAAFIGATEQNPRKGRTHEISDVVKELLDVALTALCAVEHMTGNAGTSMGQFSEHVRSVAARAGLEPVR